jgi:hypothetical protein
LCWEKSGRLIDVGFLTYFANIGKRNELAA